MGFDEKTGKLKLNKQQTETLHRARMIVKLLSRHSEDYPTAADAHKALSAILGEQKDAK